MERPDFQDPIQKKDFEIYHIKSQSLNLLENVTDNHGICYLSHNISSLTNILVVP